jgi:uncharacterized protein
MNPPVKMLLVFVNETDRSHDAPLYQAIVQILRQFDVAGATAHAGVMGFGRHHRVHHKGLFGISDDRPIMIVAVDEAQKLRDVLPEIRALTAEALMVLIDAELPI